MDEKLNDLEEKMSLLCLKFDDFNARACGADVKDCPTLKKYIDDSTVGSRSLPLSARPVFAL